MESQILESFDDRIKEIRKDLVAEMPNDGSSSDCTRLIARVDYLLATIQDIRIEKMSEEEKLQLLIRMRGV